MEIRITGHRIFAALILLAVFPASSPARDKVTPKYGFEAEVVEGERRTPDLFSKITQNQQTLNAVIYSRKNFNDFHEKESRSRPLYLEEIVKRKGGSDKKR